jgi:hypothetical protein
MPVIQLPIRTVSEANRREHHMVRYRRAKEQRAMVNIAVRRTLIPKLEDDAVPSKVRLVRMAPRLLDSDNLVSSFKAIRDEVAACLGFNDSHDIWEYRQEKSREYGIRIEVEA